MEECALKEIYQPPEVIERTEGNEGELQLQRRGANFELIYNGVFLMASYNGSGEREMVRAALRPWEKIQTGGGNQPICMGKDRQPFLQVLMGGLGFGLGLQETLRSSLVQRVDLLELEEAVIRWNRGVLRQVNGGALEDTRVQIHMEDLVQFLQRKKDEKHNALYHAIVLDTDNGPHWLSRDANRLLYNTRGTTLLKERLLPGGTLSVWSASPVPAYFTLLQQHFPSVSEGTALEQTGKNSYYYLAVKEPPGWHNPGKMSLRPKY